MIHAFFGFIVLCVFLFCCAFWIWMIVDCATKEPNDGNDKLVWIVIIVFTQIIGALIYYFVRRPQRIAQLGH
jgi:prolipoprotein diacylglyceryltransferase